MNYDASISTEVSLSKILDEMLMDGTELDVVLSFLKSHESQIDDIYRHSAFVYDLYDLASHPYRVNGFLARHVNSLHPSDMCFAAESLANFLVAEDIYPEVMKELREILRENTNVIRFRLDGYRGRFIEDEKVASGDMNFLKLVEKVTKDKRDVGRLIQESYIGRSMLMATNFTEFSPHAQFVILSTIKSMSGYPSEWHSPCAYLAHGVNTLFKQLLMLGDVDTFNWVVKVLDEQARWTHLWSNQFERIPSILGERFARDLQSFEEVVFEMNMMDTQFDTLDLFLYIYLFDPILFSGMKKNTELLEFFKLPFKWEELEKFKEADND